MLFCKVKPHSSAHFTICLQGSRQLLKNEQLQIGISEIITSCPSTKTTTSSCLDSICGLISKFFLITVCAYNDNWPKQLSTVVFSVVDLLSRTKDNACARLHQLSCTSFLLRISLTQVTREDVEERLTFRYLLADSTLLLVTFP